MVADPDREVAYELMLHAHTDLVGIRAVRGVGNRGEEPRWKTDEGREIQFACVGAAIEVGIGPGHLHRRDGVRVHGFRNV